MNYDQFVRRFGLVTLGLVIVTLVIGILANNQLLVILNIIFLTLIAYFIVSRVSARAAQKKIDGLSQMMQQMNIEPAQQGDFPWLDCGKLQKWTSELTSLGFKDLGDYTVGTGGISVKDFRMPQSFLRVMANENHQCFAEISQSFHPKTGLKDATCTILTLFASGQDCRTNNSNTSQAGVPAELIENLFQEPGSEPVELLQLHLKQREKLINDGLVLVEGTSFETYRQHTTSKVKQLHEWATQLIDQTNV